MVPRDADSPRSLIQNRLFAATRRGAVTLVLGAGVSLPRGIPNWESLAKAVWKDAFPNRLAPWTDSKESAYLKNLPQFLPVVFELAYREVGEDQFLQILRRNLYQSARFPFRDPSFSRSDESLAVLARLIVKERKRRSGNRIAGVITFNADDFIEQAICRIAGMRDPVKQIRLVRTVARSIHAFEGSSASSPTPVYHVHGFLSSDVLKMYAGHYEHMLVFTDAQYWSTSASAISFANRIMTSALCEGRCLFIGLSMTDINILRWLALRALERDRDLRSLTEYLPQARSPESPWARIMRNQFDRHFWIRPVSDDPFGFLTEFLRLRGIEAVEVRSWRDKSFAKLMSECFPNQ